MATNAVNSSFSDIDTSADDELTAKEMRHYSWLELQRGVVDLSYGDYDKARSGAKDARLFKTAGMIDTAANPSGEGDCYLQMAAQLNPNLENFHVHG